MSKVKSEEKQPVAEKSEAQKAPDKKDVPPSASEEAVAAAAKPAAAKKERKLCAIRHGEIEVIVKVPGYTPKATFRMNPAKTNAAKRAQLFDDAIDELAELIK